MYVLIYIISNNWTIHSHDRFNRSALIYTSVCDHSSFVFFPFILCNISFKMKLLSMQKNKQSNQVENTMYNNNNHYIHMKL